MTLNKTQNQQFMTMRTLENDDNFVILLLLKSDFIWQGNIRGNVE